MTSDRSKFTHRVTAAVKAELARRDMSGSDLIEILGLSKNAVYARLRYEKAFEMPELEAFCEHIGIGMGELMMSTDFGWKAAA